MGEYILSKRALRDLEEIGDYTVTKWSEDQAEIYVRMMLQECRHLADRPLIGRAYDLYRPGIRGYPCGKHVIFYRVLSQSKVRIVRILHERMDYPRHF